MHINNTSIPDLKHLIVGDFPDSHLDVTRKIDE